MSAVAVLTDQEIQEQLESESTKRPIYNPSNGWLDGRYAAQPYPLCPDGEAVDIRTGKVRTTDGVTFITDHWDTEWAVDEDKKRHQTGNRKMYASSLEIVKHLTKTFPFVVRLTGDEKKDAAIKAQAKKKWIQFRVSWARQVIAGRDAMLRSFHAEPSNAGRIPDPPTSLESEAYEFMADYQSGTIGRKEFVCKHDGYQTDDAKKWEVHERTFHAGDAAEKKKAKG